MNEATLLASLGCIAFTAAAIVLFDWFADRVLAADPENEDWPA